MQVIRNILQGSSDLDIISVKILGKLNFGGKKNISQIDYLRGLEIGNLNIYCKVSLQRANIEPQNVRLCKNLINFCNSGALSSAYCKRICCSSSPGVQSEGVLQSWMQ